ncbi:tyrosine-type recombinase/integrase, partial [Bacillus thuringiensis]|uniref:tyrosine-type recombinase/integrase n=1 Tax=Bacillus thuringiensis TaxID=1428 RepID=UPI0011A76463
PIQNYIQKPTTQLISKKLLHPLFLNHHPNPLSRQRFSKILKPLAKQPNIQKQLTPHTFPHSFSTHLLQNRPYLRAL